MTNLMEKDFVMVDDELLAEVEDDVALADAGQGWHRIGKLNIGITRFVKWVNRQPIEIEVEEWKKTPSSQRGFDFVFDVNIAEFDERARNEGWEYTRRVTFKGRDWYNILVPSLKTIFGKDSMNVKNYRKTLSEIRNQYVDILDVPQSPDKNGNIPTNTTTGKPYTTCKFFKVFKSQKEAQDAYTQLTGSSENDSTLADHYPATWKIQDEIDDILVHGGKLLNEGKEPREVIDALWLVKDSKKNEVLTKAGNPVDTKAILKECVSTIDAPDALKQSLIEKIEAM